MNVKLNNIKNIKIYPFAISDKNAEQNFYLCGMSNLSSFDRSEYGKTISTIKVNSMTIDSFVEKYMDIDPTFIRMDVEGHEYNIMTGDLKP